MLNKREWRPVVGYVGLYEVSDDGLVRSLSPKATKDGGLLTQAISQYGYSRVALCKSSKHKKFYVHRLVAAAFIPNPNDYPCVNHKDENKLNNRVDNLEWCTVKYNTNYGTARARMVFAQSKPVLQLKDGIVVKRWLSAHEAERGGFSYKKISLVCLGKGLHHRGYSWCFEADYASGMYVERPKLTRAKPVIMSKDGFAVRFFSSMEEAAAAGYNKPNICRCCKGIRMSYKGYQWRYATPEEIAAYTQASA